MKLPTFKPTYLLLAALGGGSAFALAGQFTNISRDPSSLPVAAQQPSPAANSPHANKGSATHASPASDDSASVEGDVLEVLDVPQYTYARIGTKGSEGTWVAFPSSKVAVGAHIRLVGAAKMSSFASTSLKRTFDTIWFGTLDDGRSAAGSNLHDPGDSHCEAGEAGDAHAASPHGDSGNPHGAMAGAAKPAAEIDVSKVKRAAGPNAKTVAEAISQRTTLAGKKVKLSAVVVKSTGGVLGRTYLHLRDGSGDAAAGTNDIVATSAETPKVGDTVVVEGTLVLDRDIGSGYKFTTLLEDVQVVPQ